ncbi:MAG TPA: hypothetical protein VFZ65_01760 [Planctomycetota bacterium]|nr:hypothetical protein [Planctomycetota bacterium]
MRTRPSTLLGMLLLATSLGSCFAGPHQLRRSLDDLDQKFYVNSPWFDASLWVVPIMPVGYAVAIVFDFCITDAYHFWFDDAWDGAGTGFEHLYIETTDGSVESLFMDRSGWTRVRK